MNLIWVLIAWLTSLLFFSVQMLTDTPLSHLPLAVVLVAYFRRGAAPALFAAAVAGLYEDVHRLHIGPFVIIYLLLVVLLYRVDLIWPSARFWPRIFLLTTFGATYYVLAAALSNAIFFGVSRSIQRETILAGLVVIVLTSVIPIVSSLLLRFKTHER